MLDKILSSNYTAFPLQLLISEMVFFIDKPKRKQFYRQLTIALSVYLLLTYIWSYLLFDMSEGRFFQNVLLYFGYAFMTAWLIYFCYDVWLIKLIFIVTSGYATQHMCFALYRISLYLFRINNENHGNIFYLVMTRFVIYVIVAAIMYFLIVRKNRDITYFSSSDKRIILLSSALLVTAIILSVCWSYSQEYTNIIIGIICPAYSFLCSFFVLTIEYYILRENNIKHEKKVMEQMLAMSDSQQKSAKEAIDIINIKCHDLKHQIKALANMEDNKERSEYLREIEKAVSIYDAIYHTGNKALDYILREKTLLFNEYNVEFSCMVEGESLLFMESPDIYALMGNALDNALERVLKENEEERIISLHIKNCKNMALIHLENRCSASLQFEDELPVTDKKDKNMHGFGVRSIRYIAEKYNGELFMRVKNGKFFLDILFPQ